MTRPVERLFGVTGVYKVNFFNLEETRPGVAEVVCRNSLDRVDNKFKVSEETGQKIYRWIRDGKPGMIQNVFSELTIDQREMMISGFTPEDFEEAAAETTRIRTYDE